MSGDATEPVVSVLLPAYNSSRYIEDALDSLIAQTFPSFEALVTNDASPDTPELEKVLARYEDPRIIYVKLEVNRGVGGARNACIRVARGEFVALLDGDDKWDPRFLEKMVARMRAEPDVDVLYSDSLAFGPTPIAGQRHMSRRPPVRRRRSASRG